MQLYYIKIFSSPNTATNDRHEEKKVEILTGCIFALLNRRLRMGAGEEPLNAPLEQAAIKSWLVLRSIFLY